jgi:hypothetical protein
MKDLASRYEHFVSIETRGLKLKDDTGIRILYFGYFDLICSIQLL